MNPSSSNHHHRSWSLIIIVDRHNQLSTSIMIINHHHRSWSLIIIIDHDHRSWSSIIIIDHHHRSLSSIIISNHHQSSLSINHPHWSYSLNIIIIILPSELFPTFIQKLTKYLQGEVNAQDNMCAGCKSRADMETCLTQHIQHMTWPGVDVDTAISQRIDPKNTIFRNESSSRTALCKSKSQSTKTLEIARTW